MAQQAALQLGRALAAPFVGVATWYNRTAQSHPFGVGVLTTGLKTSAADAFAQNVVEKREEFDWTRHLGFCAFGFAYLGGFQYWLYNVKFTQWCGPLTRQFGHRATAPLKVLIDQGIHHPLLYFPSFFAIKAAVAGKPLSTAVDKYRAEAWDSLKALWMVWVPAQFVNFAFVPRHLRIPYVAAVSFGWTVILSVMQGKFDDAIASRASLSTAAAASGGGGGGGGTSLPQGDMAAAAAAAGGGLAATVPAAPTAPPLPSLLPAAAAALVQQEQLASTAAAAASAAAPLRPIVAAAVAEVPSGSVAVKEA